MKTTLLFLLLFFSASHSQAQQGKLDSTFNTIDNGLLGDGFDGVVQSISLQSDNKLIVGGSFNNFNGTAVSKFCRLDVEGQIDATFVTGTGFDGNVLCSAVQTDSQVIIAGNFKMYNGAAVSKIIKTDAVGNLDAAFTANVGPITTTSSIHSIAVDQNNRIIIAGTFASIKGVTANKIARLLPNGLLDSSFFVGTGSSHQVNVVAVQLDNKILVGGNFTSFSSVSKNHIVRLNEDGSIDSTFNVGDGFDTNVETMAIASDGKILVGGSFTTYNGITVNRIVRLNTDGSLDSSFTSGSGFTSGIVYAIKLDGNGNCMVGGSFTGNYNGSVVNRIIFLDDNGQVKSNFDNGDGPNSSVFSIASDHTNSWYLAGNFTTYDALNQGRVTKIDYDGALDGGYLTPGVGFDLAVLKVVPVSDKKIVVGGSFRKFNGSTIGKLIRLTEEGNVDSSFNFGEVGSDDTVRSILVQPDGKIIAGGAFKNYNGNSAGRIIRLNENGKIDGSFVSGTGFNNQVYIIRRQDDGKFLVGGNFTSYNALPANRIIRLNSDGTVDMTFNSQGADAYVEQIEVQPDGKIIVGGRFTVFNGLTCSRMIRLNAAGSTDNTFTIEAGFGNNIYAMALQPDGKILAGGSFISYKSVSQKRMIRLNSDGSLDATFAIGTGFSKGDIRTILLQKDGRILVGGTFTGTYNGTPVSRLVRLHKDGSIDISFESSLNGTLYSVAITSDNKAIIGGNFNSVAGKAKHRVARLRLCTNSSTYSEIWSNEQAADGMELTFEKDYEFTTSVYACSCTIALGKTVKIASGNTLGLSFGYSGLGTLVIKDKASLYQDDDEVINTSHAVIEKTSTPMKNFDYTYWSSPVLNQTAKNLSPNTFPDKYYRWQKDWVFDDGTMQAGKGYIIRVPKPGAYTNGEKAFENSELYEQGVKFEGIPNNGNIIGETTLPDEFFLVGNPYASAINADTFLDKNEFLNGTIYLWTHDTPITQSGSFYVYTSADYASYNRTGAVITGPKGVPPSGKIASGQSFFTFANAIGTIKFDNSMRLVGQNNQFFKPSKNKKENTISERHRVWLNLMNEDGIFKQLLVGYVEGATNNFDTRFDGVSLNGNAHADFYTISGNRNFTIQGRSLPFEIADEVPVGYISSIEGKFSIDIHSSDGDLAIQAIYLKDKKLNVTHDLRKSGYSFSTEKGVFDDRFVLIYADQTLGIEEQTIVEKDIKISTRSKTVQLFAVDTIIDEVVIYDLLGRELFRKNEISSTEFSWNGSQIPTQVLVVKVVLQNNKIMSQKIVLK
ncbi:T9SS sorting signal type C domain-containing protein [Flavobacterium sp. TMP13]|uniref:T9SS sorting signal type C domain-containing protein n=1 Tax=Flavobacterium sp. TMP13 TaxID=3425950 RepID=UPI003D76C457